MLAGASALMVVCIVMYPEQAFHSSLDGLSLWWNIVFPILLPCFIACEMMAGFGVMHGLGVLFEPLTRALFRIPGVSGWALSFGFAFGYPAGADIVARLHRDEQLNRDEAQRLLAISHMASPVLIIGIIGAGFLGHAPTGFFIALIHYSTAFMMALCMNFLMPLRSSKLQPLCTEKSPPWLGSRLLNTMLEARERDGRSFGRLLGDSVSISVHKLFIVGGYMMMFSVLIQMLSLTGFTALWRHALEGLVQALPAASDVKLPGLALAMEVHLGAHEISQNDTISAALEAAFIGVALAWSGFASHAQALSFVRACGVSYRPFVMARLLHAGFAFAATLLFWKPFMHRFGLTDVTLTDSVTRSVEAGNALHALNGAQQWTLTLTFLAVMVALLLVGSLLSRLWSVRQP
jgi:sporulation integral membrane protein YlbJ